jgi:hypothetical protein
LRNSRSRQRAPARSMVRASIACVMNHTSRSDT